MDGNRPVRHERERDRVRDQASSSCHNATSSVSQVLELVGTPCTISIVVAVGLPIPAWLGSIVVERVTSMGVGEEQRRRSSSNQCGYPKMVSKG